MNVTEACREVRHSKKFSKFLEVTSLNFYQNDCRISSISPRSFYHFGDYGKGLNKRGLMRQGGLFTQSDDKHIDSSFLVLYPIFCGISYHSKESNKET